MRLSSPLSRRIAAASIALMVTTSMGCGTLAGAGAGAGAAAYISSRGVESQVNAPIAQAHDATLRVLRARDITVQRVDVEAHERMIDAQLGDLNIDIDLDRVDANVTQIVVKASRAPLGRDNDFASDLLSDIVREVDRARVTATGSRTPVTARR